MAGFSSNTALPVVALSRHAITSRPPALSVSSVGLTRPSVTENPSMSFLEDVVGHVGVAHYRISGARMVNAIFVQNHSLCTTHCSSAFLRSSQQVAANVRVFSSSSNSSPRYQVTIFTYLRGSRTWTLCSDR